LTPFPYFDNVEFLVGDIEAIPLPDDSVDVISNCVINRSADQDRMICKSVDQAGFGIGVADVDGTFMSAFLRARQPRPV
jgi:hypothetical protein